jgi:hypothetical protein
MQLHHTDALQLDFDNWISQLADELVASGAALRDPSMLCNAG